MYDSNASKDATQLNEAPYQLYKSYQKCHSVSTSLKKLPLHYEIMDTYLIYLFLITNGYQLLKVPF